MTVDREEKQPEFPPQSERGECELRINDQDKLYCEKQRCEGDCVLFSLPRDNPGATPKEEEQPCAPEKDRYYYCKCMPQL